jgi:methionine-rich copper-binding protein CopC
MNVQGVPYDISVLRGAFTFRRKSLTEPIRMELKMKSSRCIHSILCVAPILAAVVVATPAHAHSELRSSVPVAGEQLECAPDQIDLHFYDGVQLTALRLYRVDGDEIVLPRRSIREAKSETIELPLLEPGEFRAEWRIISSDGHPAGGVIPFSVSAECPNDY